MKTYNKLMDALNLIDEQAEQMGGNIDEREEREKAYNMLADFIKDMADKKVDEF